MRLGGLVGFVVFAGCGVSKPSGVTYEQDIAPLVQARCQSCHVASGIAPFALTTYDEVFAMRGAMRAAVESKKMPPFLASKSCTDYYGDLTLSDDEIALFGKWIDDGSPRGTPDPSRQLPDGIDIQALPRVDATIGMAEQYTPQTRPDEYRCFVLDWNEATDKYVTGMRVLPGNPKIVHHVIAFLALPSEVADLQQRDAADPRPGYECFGGPGGQIRNWLGSWAPGIAGGIYPPNTGLKVQAGSKVVLQMHYNLQSAPADASDQTQLQVMLADTVERPAVIMLWANPTWSDNHSGMEIPAFQSDVMHEFTYDPTPVQGVISEGALKNGQDLHIYAAGTHMHLLGKSSKLEILRAGDPAQSECVLDIPQWDFHWQRQYPLAHDKVFHPGDQLRITCHWDNSAAAQPYINGVQQMPHDVNWGEGTGDEMCLGLLYVTN
jgi:hypothetical protein